MNMKWSVIDKTNAKSWYSQGMTTREIARRLGRNYNLVRAMLYHMGLARYRKKFKPGELTNQIRELHAQGLSDAAIGMKLGIGYRHATKARRSLGLGYNKPPPSEYLSRRRKGIKDSCRRYGSRTWTEYMRGRDRQRTMYLGWPCGCSTRQAKYMESLESLGRTNLRSWSVAMGIRWLKGNKIIQTLVRSGWVLKQRQGIKWYYQLSGAVIEGRTLWRLRQQECAA